MLIIIALIAFTLSVYLSNAQDPQFPWQMPKYQAGGLSFSPILPPLKESPQQELYNPQEVFPLDMSDPQGQLSSSSQSQRCVVEQYARIECGEPDITPAECEAISCCHDGQRCYYGKAVTLQCTRDGQFVLVVAQDATLRRISLDSIQMLEDDPSGQCASVDRTASFAIYQFPVSSCGTRMNEESGSVIYENMMSSVYEVGIGPHESLTRDSAYELKLECRYSGTAVEALVVEVNKVPPPPHVLQQGPLGVELRLASGQCTTKGCTDEDMYTSYYSELDYPVTKVLREPVYVELRILELTDPNIILVLDHCWATFSKEPLSLPQWDLVVDGCTYKDDHYLTTIIPLGESGLQHPSHFRRFVLKLFTFVNKSSLVPLQEPVFIHCSTSLCHSSARESCEPSCGRTKESPTNLGLHEGRSISHDLRAFEEEVLVSSGEVILLSDLPVLENLTEEEVPQTLAYVLWVTASLTVFGVCGLVLAVLIQRSKPQPAPV